MSSLQIPDGLRIWVTHYRDPEAIVDLRADELPRKTPFIAATCVELRDGETVLSRGWSYCSEKDQFSKKKGRDIATGRALKQFKENNDSTS